MSQVWILDGKLALLINSAFVVCDVCGVGVTYVQAEGSYIIATRSMNSDINPKLKPSKSNGYIKSLVCMYIYVCMHACMYACCMYLKK